ncbi:hypothetical protein BDY19DRAFT_107486 [Irpex rosettiformis]|uniref:Uncharacterized protein n=1 Tax=Irpex rosettiformis TaxID=378272 RepID=A0ACB8U5L8_9APHY|nr:hypothetical protein BDY19DRAFT_107486 [Irpex rosettiformis]
MSGIYYGPILPNEFIDKFMPVTNLHALEKFGELSKKVKFTFPIRTEWRAPERTFRVRDAFKSAIREYEVSPEFKFFVLAEDLENSLDNLTESPSRPDGCFEDFPRASAQIAHFHDTRHIRHNTHADEPREENRRAITDDMRAFNWHTCGLTVTFTRSSTEDPFYTRPEIENAIGSLSTVDISSRGTKRRKCVPFERPGKDHGTVRDRLLLYASKVFSHQHRVHLIQLLIYGRRARFLLWDHSGAIVSDEFDYTQDSALLAKFIFYYNYMSDSARGLDSTASLASVDERIQFEAAVKQFLANMDNPEHPQRRLPHAADALNPRCPVYKITIKDDHTKELVKVLVQHPFSHAYIAIGRGTRGYLAFHLGMEKLKFLKDTWRVFHDSLTPERTIYRDLEAAGITEIPRVLCGGDVLDNKELGRTQCSKRATELKLAGGHGIPLRDFQQHRLLEDIAYPVTSALNSKEYVHIFFDCFETLALARKRCNILHRDVSIRSIMLMLQENGNAVGILADWDYSSKVGCTGHSHQNYRPGTWQFMSIATLEDPEKGHDVLDDYESVFWSLLYGAMHFIKQLRCEICMDIFNYQGDVELANGTTVIIGGVSKRDALRGIRRKLTFVSAPLTYLVHDMAGVWMEYYALKDEVGLLSYQCHNQQPQKDFSQDLALRIGIPPPPSESESDDITSLSAKFDRMKEVLFNPVYWLNKLFSVYHREDWPAENDVSPVDFYPQEMLDDETLACLLELQDGYMSGEEMKDAQEQESSKSMDRVEGIDASCGHPVDTEERKPELYRDKNVLQPSVQGSATCAQPTTSRQYFSASDALPSLISQESAAYSDASPTVGTKRSLSGSVTSGDEVPPSKKLQISPGYGSPSKGGLIYTAEEESTSRGRATLSKDSRNERERQ